MATACVQKLKAGESQPPCASAWVLARLQQEKKNLQEDQTLVEEVLKYVTVPRVVLLTRATSVDLKTSDEDRRIL